MDEGWKAPKAYRIIGVSTKTEISVGDVVKLTNKHNGTEHLGRAVLCDGTLVMMNNSGEWFDIRDWSFQVLHTEG